MPAMSTLAQTLALTLTVVIVFFWLKTPGLEAFSLQIFAACVALYFIVKKVTKGKFWHITPGYQSIEMVIATFALLLVVGSTGNLNSVVYPLTFLHLFFLVFATSPSTSLVTMAAIVLFHYGLSPGTWQADLPELLTIPLMYVLFSFAKLQYDELQRDRAVISQEEAELVDLSLEEQSVVSFLHGFVNNKLELLKQLVGNFQENRQAMLGQIMLLQIEIEKLLSRVNKETKN